MKTILVATDFSICASNAMAYAMKLAKVLRFEVCAIHAIGPLEGVNNNTYSAIYIKDYQKNKKQALAEWANVYSTKEKFKEVSVKTHCQTGSVAVVLSKYIASNPVDILVMGNMGATGISGLFGSNVNTMVTKTRIPILIIPLQSRFSKKPVITLATDFATNMSAEDVIGLNELAIAFGTKKLNVLNIIAGGDWKTNTVGENNLKAILPNTELDFKYINESSTVEGILNYIVSGQTDILCVVKHHHNLIYRLFNKSMVNQVMNKSIKAVLVLHE